MAAQEASYSMSPCTYHALLSFRGKDLRKNFTDHLYTALVQAGIHTFLDDDDIERGENIQVEHQKAIQESKISIIVFSRDYASSRWCLDELVMIMERRRIGGHTVVPVFYDVDPSQVRKQTGSFAEAFARHEKQFKEEMDKVETWKAALREVADLAGMALNNRYESIFIQDIVKEIWKKLYQPVLNVVPHLVGIDSRVKDINLWLRDGSNDVGIAIIFGIGGIGKTTIAKIVHNLNHERFQGRSFLASVRDTSKEPNGLVRLQSQLLSDLLKGKINGGNIKIKDVISSRTVLLVLDDVDHLDQLDAIIGMREWFCPGSKIIITTTHERLLKAHESCLKFNVKELDDTESLQLFSWHAFGQGHPIEGYMECSRSVVHHCGGLPLALQVLGSSLSGKSISVWESALQKLEAIPDNKIQKVLKVSYDSLQDDHDQNLFLDIACFFIEEDKDYTVAILDGCDYYTTIGIQNLIDRCLLVVNDQSKMTMHQLLRDMGREIIRQESIDDPGKRSRLWHHKEAFSVLKEKTGTETVKGLTLDLRRLNKNKHGKKIGNCSKRRRLGFFSWQPMNTASENSFSFSNEIDLQTKTFMKMHKLKLLQLKYVKLKGDYEDILKNLIWLCWHGFPLESIPTNFHLEKLVALDMRYSNLKQVWKGTKFLAELKFLDLSHSHCLVRTSDFLGLLRLERLMLKDCINLVEVDESIGNLDRLVLLDLTACKNLRKLPRKIGMLKSLEELFLSGCSKLDDLPMEMRKMESLKVLHVDGINQLHATSSNTKKLSLLSTTSWYSALRSWLSLTKAPHSTSFSLAFLPQSLVSLSLENCNLSDDVISYGLSSLPSLQYLYLSQNPFHSLPESIKGLTMLKDLTLMGCRELQSLPEFPRGLRRLNLFGCLSLERVSNISVLSLLPTLQIDHCEKLIEVEGFFKLEPLKNADVAILKSLGLSNLEALGSIEEYMYSPQTSRRWKTPLQMLHECGVHSIFLPGSEVPSCFSLQSTRSSISIDVPPLAGHKICGLNLCTLYDKEFPEYARINNKTKRMKWTYGPICYVEQGAEKKDMLWLSHWKIGEQLEGGDQIDVSVVWNPDHKAKMWGICFVYEPEDKDTQSKTDETVRSAIPWYQTVTLTTAGSDVYFRCHHGFTYHRRKLYTSNIDIVEPNLQLELDTCIICKDD